MTILDDAKLWAAEDPQDYGSDWTARQNYVIAIQLANRGEIAAARGKLSGGSGPRFDLVSTYVESLAPNAANLKTQAVLTDKGYQNQYVTLTDAQKKSLEKDNKLTQIAVDAVEKGQNPNVAYGLAIAGQEIGDLGETVANAAKLALSGWKSIILVGIAVISAVGIGYVAIARKSFGK